MSKGNSIQGRRWRRSAILLILAVAVATAFTVGSQIVSTPFGTKVEAAPPPTTWTVCPVGCDFATIGAALADVNVVNGDTIDVAEGTYNEMLTITKEITLLGEQADVEPSAGSRVGNESIINNTYPIAVAANNVTINGFEFTNFDHAILAVGDYSYLTVKYNRMVNAGADYGITFGWAGHSATPPVFDHVTIAHNLISGPATAVSFEGGDGDGTNGVDARFAWIDISYNHFGNLSNVSIAAGASPDDYTIDHFTLKGNYFDDAELNCLLGNILFGEMSGNLVKGSPCVIGMQASLISGNSFVANGDAGFLGLLGLYALVGPSPSYVRPTGNVVVTNNDFTNEALGAGLMVLPDNPTTDNISVTTNAFRDSGVGTNSSSTTGCFLNDLTGWIVTNYGNCGSDGTPDIRSQYLHADNNWWGGQDGTSDNSGSLYGKVTTDSWMSYYIDDPAKEVAPANWPLSEVMTEHPGFWPINARYRAVFTESADPRTIDLDDAAIGAPALTVAGIGTGGAVFQFSTTEQPAGPTPFKVAPNQVFLNVAVLSGNVVYPAQLCIYGEPGYELYHYVGGEWVKVSNTQVDNIICSTDLSVLGIFTVAQPKDMVYIQYTGDTYVETSGSTVNLKARLTSSPACIDGRTVYFVNDLNGNGIADGGEPILGSGTTNSSGDAVSSFIGTTGIYEIVIYVEGNDDCLEAHNTATIVVAGTGYASTGGGWYTNNGRINFGYTVQIKNSRLTGLRIVSGQMLWHMQGKTRLKGVVNGYTQIPCPIQTDPTLPIGTRCAYVTGYGDLYEWDSDLEMWVMTMPNIGYQVTVGDGGGFLKRRNGSNVFPDFFMMNFPTLEVRGEAPKLLQLKGGNLIVK
jgi:hypothetical protein